MNLRKLSVDDIDLLIQLRIDFLLDEEVEFSEGKLMSMKQRCRDFFTSAFAANRFIAFVAENDGTVLSTAFLTVQERPPRQLDAPFQTGTVYNVLTYEKYRKRGFATQVLTALLDEAKAMGIPSVDLWATKDGEKVYEKLGFWKIHCTPMRIDF